MSKKDLNYYLNLPYKIVLEKDSTNEFIAYIPQLKGCITQGKNEEEAIKMLKDAQQVWIESALEDGISIPEPKNNVNYSGKFLIRVPKSLHRTLAEQAKEEGISLNQYINYKLSESVGEYNTK